MEDDRLEDELDHDEDGGDEEHREQHRKMRRVEARFEEFLADVADDMVEPELVVKIEKKMVKELAKANLSPTFNHIKAFATGFAFGMRSTMKLDAEVAKLLMGIKKVVKDKDAQKGKITIDITQSKPLDGKGK